jgi:hypothetical protein
MKKFPPMLLAFGESDMAMHARTNNALERYNRRIREQFNFPHPNVYAFVKVIKEECIYLRVLLQNIRSVNEAFPCRQDC